MKNQYFGDINDYKKYGLLRMLSNSGHNKLAVCWMLTPNDGGTDGEFRSYLDKPAKWRHYDPDLFDSLKGILIAPNERSVMLAEKNCLIPGAIYYSSLLRDETVERQQYFSDLLQQARGADIIFLDPDNGLEIRSVRKGCKRSCKYLFWDEVKPLYSARSSLLIYQHYPHVKREDFVKSMASQMTEQTEAKEVFVFQTSNVAFFLIPQHDHAERFTPFAQQVKQGWGSEIEVQHYTRTTRGELRLISSNSDPLLPPQG